MTLKNSPKMAETQAKILKSLVFTAAFEGWNDHSLKLATQEAGYDAAMAEIAFPGGLADAISLFIEQMDAEMQAKLAKDKLAAMKIRERIKHAVMVRLNLYAPHREAMRRLMSYFALPANAFAAAKHLASTADLIWRAAGDTSTDFNYYTKRALLSGVYSTTLLYWLNDESEGFSETEAFLGRRIENVMQIQKLRSTVEKNFEGLMAKFSKR